MRMAALYVVPSWFTLHYHLRGHISFIRSRGFDVVIAGNEDQRAVDAAMREGASYHAVDINTDSISPLRDFRAMYRILQLARAHGCGVIYCCTKKGALLSGLAGRLARVPLIVYHVRGVRGLVGDGVHPFRKAIFMAMERITCALVHRVVFISRSNMELYTGMNICPSRKAAFFGGGSSNGVDTERFKRTAETKTQARELRAEHRIPEGVFVIGFVGRPVVEKGIRELLDAWKIIRDRHMDAHLLVVSPPETDCPATIESLAEDKRVHFTGFMKEPAAAYAAMDCLLAPSHEIEGFGNIATEAGAMELPVVATRVTGLVDAVADGETGLLVKPINTHALVEAVENLIVDRDFAARLGTNGRHRCISQFRQEIIWDGFAELYRNADGACAIPWEHRGGSATDSRDTYA